jgi:hypothetical protein
MRAAVFSILAIGAIAWASSAMAQVYKCTQEGGRVLYSDSPCKRGAIVDVNGGAANPAAVRQLARDNAAFDRRMAARRVAEDQAEFRRQQINAQLEAARASQGTAMASDAGAYSYDGVNAFGAAARLERQSHSRHAARAIEHRVPARPASPTSIRRQNQ